MELALGPRTRFVLPQKWGLKRAEQRFQTVLETYILSAGFALDSQQHFYTPARWETDDFGLSFKVCNL